LREGRKGKGKVSEGKGGNGREKREGKDSSCGGEKPPNKRDFDKF